MCIGSIQWLDVTENKYKLSLDQILATPYFEGTSTHFDEA